MLSVFMTKKMKEINEPSVAITASLHLCVTLSLFPASISGTTCDMVLSVFPLLFLSRHQTQISYLGYCPERQGQTQTHNRIRTQIVAANNKSPICLLRCRPRGRHSNTIMIKSEDRVLSAVSIIVFILVGHPVMMNKGMYASVHLWIHVTGGGLRFQGNSLHYRGLGWWHGPWQVNGTCWL